MEVCPKCGSISIEWDGWRGCFRCLVVKCCHTWKSFGSDLIRHKDIKNTALRVSLPPGHDLPGSEDLP
jgi:hypothetical protein